MALTIWERGKPENGHLLRNRPDSRSSKRIRWHYLGSKTAVDDQACEIGLVDCH